MWRNVAILGAAGRMGRWLCRFLSNEGFNVSAYDINVEKLSEVRDSNPKIKLCSLEKCVTSSDVVVISVPINSFESVIKELKPYVRSEHLIIDICSVKGYPVEVMHKLLEKGIKLGTHPLFGPGSSSISKKKVVMTPINGDEINISYEIARWLEEREGLGIVMDPVEHDRLMSVIMGVSHAVGLVLSTYLSDLDLNTMKLLSTPTYNFMLKYSTAILSGNFDLYLSIQKHLRVGEELRKLIKIINDFIDGVERDPDKVLNELLSTYSKIVSKGLDVRKSYEEMYGLYEKSLP